MSEATTAHTNPDMEDVGDHDDCLRCARMDDECGFHQGLGAGMAAAFELMREFVDDPELMVGAIDRRNRTRRLARERGLVRSLKASNEAVSP